MFRTFYLNWLRSKSDLLGQFLAIVGFSPCHMLFQLNTKLLYI